MPVEKLSVAAGPQLPALLSLLASCFPRVRLPSATVIRFPLEASMGDKRGSEISYRSLSAELPPSGCERELNLQSLLTYNIQSSYSIIQSSSNLIWVVIHQIPEMQCKARTYVSCPLILAFQTLSILAFQTYSFESASEESFQRHQNLYGEPEALSKGIFTP